jgi:hypothetical protein
MNARRGLALPKEVEAALREFVNALGKATMYPPGHRFIEEASSMLAERLAAVLESRGALTLGITPRGLLLDGTNVEPLPSTLRAFAARLHRKNVGTVHFSPGVGVDEVAELLSALSGGDADERVGREGLRLNHVRVEPLTYDVLAFAEGSQEQDLDDVFWSRLVEAAFDRRLSGDEPLPNGRDLAEAINERVNQSPEGARRVYEALAGFASALAVRGERAAGSARRRFVEVLTALSKPATTAVMAAAPSTASRRRFLRETLEQVPPALLLQLLESVAEADGEPISPHLRWLLGKLAGAEGGNRTSRRSGNFATQVMGLVEQWDGVEEETVTELDPRFAAEDSRVVALGLEISSAAGSVLAAGQALAARGHLNEVLQLLDQPGNDPKIVATIADGVLEPGLLTTLLEESTPEWPLIERIVLQLRVPAVDPLITALDKAEERNVRRRLLDLLVKIGPSVERPLVARLPGASWHLSRNLLAILVQLPELEHSEAILPMMSHSEIRVRHEALKALVKVPVMRERAISEALESNEVTLVRIALASLEGRCPPALVGHVLSVLAMPDEETRLAAIKLLSDVDNPLIVPPLLALVRVRSGFLRRWKLLPRSPVMLAALGVLLRRWSGHRPVLMVMQLAAKSNDPDVREMFGARS